MERREFLLYSFRAGTVMAIPIIYASCSKDEDEAILPPEQPDPIIIDLDSSEYSNLKNDGQYVYIGEMIIVNLGNEQFVALSSSCTHEGCTINYNHAAGNLPCPCHGSVFSTTGSVLQGPAPVEVHRYTISREGNILTIK